MNRARLLFGSVIVAVGTLLLLDYANVLDADAAINTWWPLVLVAAGLLALFGNPRHWLGPVAVVIAGTILLLRTTEVVAADVVGPLLLVIVGLLVVFGRGFTHRWVRSPDRVSAFNVFSGSEIASKSDHFEGGSVGAIFGGAEVDLRGAAPAPGAELDMFVAFGGAEVKVPEGWRVQTHALPIFGSVKNITASEPVMAGAPTLDLSATVIFGGIEVKH
ncbi:MAG TPA: DUF5668 domain-containing protein [Acidimicrobiia bacterium]